MRVLALFAHPDDAEFLCGGTLAHLAARGARIGIATMTAGDCGSGRAMVDGEMEQQREYRQDPSGHEIEMSEQVDRKIRR